jgi:hypothetical protein
MKNILYLALLLSLFCACSNDFESKLRGQWQLQDIVVNGKDSLLESPVYYCFQNQVFQIKDKSGAAFGRFYSKGDSLCIIFEDPEQKQALLSLQYAGWTSEYKSFYITKLSSNKLYLKSKIGLFKFRLY